MRRGKTGSAGDAARPAITTHALDRTALAARAYAGLKGIVLDHELPPGSHLAIDTLARRLGTSPAASTRSSPTPSPPAADRTRDT